MEYVSPEGLRQDGRRPKELRQLGCQFGVLAKADGSATFQMGNTKVSSVTDRYECAGRSCRRKRRNRGCRSWSIGCCCTGPCCSVWPKGSRAKVKGPAWQSYSQLRVCNGNFQYRSEMSLSCAGFKTQSCWTRGLIDGPFLQDSAVNVAKAIAGQQNCPL